MSGGGALNLSLLSRGIGEVQKNGHEKVEVFLEPSDYFNFAADRPYYLPPIQQSYHFAETSPRFSTRSSRDGSEIPLPKTFTTRKGALLLFSEDMAMKTNEKEQTRKGPRQRHQSFHSSFSPHGSLNEDETAMVLKTVDDLAKSILQYGASRHGYEEDHDKMYLKFIHRRREQWERQIRPGYSAKRYLSTWTRNWDDQVFETVVSKGYLTERSLFHYNLFLPHLRRHLFHEDLSNMPQPYRLMKNMLLSPGSLSGYTFYRAADFGALMEEDEDGADGQKIKRPGTKRSIRVIRTSKDGIQKEVSYSALDKDTQKEVITDLLVKSAVHYALSKQEEIIEESLAQAMQSEHGESSATTYELSLAGKTPAEKSVPGFDMRDAVDSLLNTQRGNGPYVLGGDLPEPVDAHSHSSEHTGSFKGGAVPQHAVRSMGDISTSFTARQTPRSSWPASVETGGGSGGGKDKEFLGDLPVAAVRDVSASSSQSQQSSVPQLPPITRHTLSPIKDVSRETSQLVTLPPIFKDGQEELKQNGNDMPTVKVVPPTPQMSNLSMHTPHSEAQQPELQKVIEAEAASMEADAAETAAASEYQASSDSSPADSVAILTHRTGKTAKSSNKTSKGPRVSQGEDVSKGKVILFQPPQRTSNLPAHNVIPALPQHGHGWECGRLVEGQGHRTGRSMAGGSVESKSMKGSMIMAPDGEIISVGGSVAAAKPHDVGVISDVTLQQRQFEVNITDESGMSDDDPDEWRAASKMRKPRTLSSKLSESLKRSVSKRESETSLGSGPKSVVSSHQEEQEAEPGPSIIIKKSSVASKEADIDSLASASIPSQTGRSSVTEQDILDTLTEHAKMIADSVLSNKQAGQDLEEDVRIAADMWMESHPTQNISRSHSVQDAFKAGAIDEIMKSRRASSAGPSTEEYKDLIRQSLTTAVAKAAGLDPEAVPEDAEISPDLLDALASQKLTPDDIAIVHDEETGRAVIKSRQEITQALGGVAEGHIYITPNGKGGSIAGSDVGMKRQMSIPADRASLVDNMDFDVISYGGTEIMSERGRPAGRSKAGSKPGSLAGGAVADLRDHPIDPTKLSGDNSPEAEQDEFAQRLQQMEKEKNDGDGKSASLKGSIKEEELTPALPGDSFPNTPLDLDRQSEKSAKTGVSQKSDDSKKKEKKVKTPEEPFVVGKTDEKGKLEKLYGPVDEPPKKKDKVKAETKPVEKSPELSPRLPDKSPRHSGKSDVPQEKSPRPKEKSPQPKSKSPRQQKQEKPSPKPVKTPRPEPAGEEAPEAEPPKPKEEKAPKRAQRQKKEKTANPRRGSKTVEAELKAREEKEKAASFQEIQAEAKAQEEEVKPVDVEEKAPEEPPPSTKPAEKLDTEPAAKASSGKTSPQPQEGVVDHKAELSKLYGAQGPGTLPSAKTETKSPVKGKKAKKDDKKEKGKKKGTKGKKKGKKEEEPTPEAVEEPPAPEPPAPEPVVETKKPTPQPTPREPEPPKPLTASSSERPFISSPELTRTDDEMEFTIVREESSPEPDPPQRLNIPPSFPEEEEEVEEEEEEIEDPGEDNNLKSISNREARAAKRAAAAAKRKEEVEKRRREREEQLKREKEEQERQEQLKKEMETERKRREEERRLRKQQEAEEAAREERAKLEAERKKRQAEERDRRAKEEYQRRLEEMRKKQIEEEAKRMELLIQKQKEEEERRAAEELMMSEMAEQERLEYERRKAEEEAERKRLEEEERRKQEEDAQRAMEEARRLAEEMARKQAELEARLKFNRALQVEASGLDHSHDINRAFVFSYFELLQWLGLDIPEFELTKMTQPL